MFCCSRSSKSYVWSSLGVTATAFLTGAMAFWTPAFLSRAQLIQTVHPECTEEPCNATDNHRCCMTFDLHHPSYTSFPSPKSQQTFNNGVCLCLYSYIFGAVTVATGIMGACLGTGLSKWFRDKVPNVDPLICAVGLLGSAPCLCIAVFVASESIPATYVRDNLLSVVCQSVHHSCPDWNISTTGLCMHSCPQKLNPTDFGDPLNLPVVPSCGSHFWFLVKCLDNLWVDCHEIWFTRLWTFGDPSTFHPAPPSRQHFNLSNTLVYDQIPAKNKKTFASASAVLCVWR